MDAAVAATAALGVVEPMMTGIGGDLFAMLWSEADKRAIAFDGSGKSPQAASLEALRARGHRAVPESGRDAVLSVSVPGAVEGWARLLDAHGTLALDTVLAPAIDLAMNGFAVPQGVAASWSRAAHSLVEDGAGSGLLPGGRAPHPHEVIRLPLLARSLELIASGGPAAMYTGELAERIVQYTTRLGGWIEIEDLAGHEGRWVEPMTTWYRGVELLECPPNSQGLAALVAAAIAAGLDSPARRHGGAPWIHLLIEAMKIGLNDAFATVGGDEEAADESGCLQSTRIDANRRRISAGNATVPFPTLPFRPPSDTAYVCAVDEHGNGASVISSLFRAFGSGLVVPDTGVVLQNRGALFSVEPDHPAALRGGVRPFHTIIPAMALRQGRLWAVFGVVGGFQQAQAHLQILSRLVDEELPPQEAVDAARFNIDVEGENRIRIESSTPEVAAALEGMGHPIAVASREDSRFFGGAQILTVAESGVITGGSDSRRDGVVASW